MIWHYLYIWEIWLSTHWRRDWDFKNHRLWNFCDTINYPCCENGTQPLSACSQQNNKDNNVIISLPPTPHKFWIAISITSSKFKVLGADIWENSLTNLTHAEQTARISKLLPAILFSRHTMLGGFWYPHTQKNVNLYLV